MNSESKAQFEVWEWKAKVTKDVKFYSTMVNSNQMMKEPGLNSHNPDGDKIKSSSRCHEPCGSVGYTVMNCLNKERFEDNDRLVVIFHFKDNEGKE